MAKAKRWWQRWYRVEWIGHQHRWMAKDFLDEHVALKAFHDYSNISCGGGQFVRLLECYGDGTATRLQSHLHPDDELENFFVTMLELIPIDKRQRKSFYRRAGVKGA